MTLLLAARDAGDITAIIVGVVILGVLAAFVVRLAFRSDKAPASAPQQPTETATDEAKCPCGRPATKPVPRYKVWKLPLIGRIVFPASDPFGKHEVCEVHAGVGGTVIDEQIAMAKLLEAQAQRAKLTALANNTADTLGQIVQSLPEEKQKAYARSLRPAPVVRVLKAAGGEEGESG